MRLCLQTYEVYLVSMVVCEPPVQVCGVKTRGETAALEGAQGRWCSRFGTDDIKEGELQGCVVLMSPLMLGKTMAERLSCHVVGIHVSLIKQTRDLKRRPDIFHTENIPDKSGR